MEPKRFYRSRTNNVIGGVCGGLAQYFNIDPVIARVLFVLMAIYAGSGLLIYLILWIVIPREPFTGFESNTNVPPSYDSEPVTHTDSAEYVENDEATSTTIDPKSYQPVSRGSLLGGLILITLGVLFLIARFVPNIDFGDLWPVLLIVIGGVILAGSLKLKNK